MTALKTYLATVRTSPGTAVGSFPSPRDYVGGEASDDAKLKVWLAEAIVWVDTKIDSRDLDADQLDLATAGVYEYVRARFDARNRGIGIRKTKTGRREEEYSGAEAGRIDQAQLAAWSKIADLCEDPSLFSAGGGW